MTLKVGDTIRLLNLPDQPLHQIASDRELSFAEWLMNRGKAMKSEGTIIAVEHAESGETYYVVPKRTDGDDE